MDTSLPRTSPEAQGIASSVILDFVEALDRDIKEPHSLMIVRHGTVIAEGWWTPYRADLPHMLYSLSKSFTSSAIGLAVAEGRLSIDDPVISFFPDETPAEVSDNLAAMQVRHLLMMGTGHDVDTTGALRDRTDWIRTFLEQPVEHEPGTFFVYNSGATYMLSAIIQCVTGMRVLDYLTPRLLEPLGITGATWEQSPEGIDVGGWGLRIKTADIARFGQLYLQKGKWNGQQILPEAWVEQATSKQIDNGDDPASDWAQGYCFQFWRCQHNAYRGDGAHGQYCVVMPDQDVVIAITSGVRDMQAVLNLVWDRLLPAFEAAPQADPLPENPTAAAALKEKLARLTLPPPAGSATSPLAAQVSGRTYHAQMPAEIPAPLIAQSDTVMLEAVALDFQAAQATITLTVRGSDFTMTCGYGAWIENDGIDVLFMLDSPALASGVWISDDTFVVTIRLYETPYCYTLTFRLSEDGLVMESLANVGSTEPMTSHLA